MEANEKRPVPTGKMNKEGKVIPNPMEKKIGIL